MTTLSRRTFLQGAAAVAASPALPAIALDPMAATLPSLIEINEVTVAWGVRLWIAKESGQVIRWQGSPTFASWNDVTRIYPHTLGSDEP